MYNFNKNMIGVEDNEPPACQCCGPVKTKEATQKTGCSPQVTNSCCKTTNEESKKPTASGCSSSCS